MKTFLAYGKAGLSVEFDEAWNVSVVTPRHSPACDNEEGALREALRNPIESAPLRELVRPGQRVGIVFSDITRPTPNHLLIPAVLRELDQLSPDSVTLFNALGTHRPNTAAELEQMLGKEIVARYPIVQNSAFDPSTQVHLGTTSRGHEIWLNRELVECDFKILTGFIEPHFFAGFSGGGKAIMPGMAGLPTVLGNHDAGMVASPEATWGRIEGNPIWGEIREVASRLEPDFLLNVTLNREKRITRVFAGEWESAHRSGCEFARETAMVPVAGQFDIVLTTNSGYPLDLNLYQTVKGMSAAAQVVKPGGTIIAAAECWDGIPEHGLYGQLLREAGSPKAVLDMVCAPGFLKQDQWQAQLQAQIQLKAEVYVYSENLSDSQIESALLRPCRSIEKTVGRLLKTYGADASICVLPEGPQTIPYVSGR
jgi:lactate racemase